MKQESEPNTNQTVYIWGPSFVYKWEYKYTNMLTVNM